jgi:hypothetical protein
MPSSITVDGPGVLAVKVSVAGPSSPPLPEETKTSMKAPVVPL